MRRWNPRVLFSALTLAAVLGGVVPAAQAAPVDLLVASDLTNNVKRYDGATGAYLGDFVSAGPTGQLHPHALTIGPDGNLYVSGGGVNGGGPTQDVKRYDGTTGAFIDVFTSGHGTSNTDIIFGPDGNLYGSAFGDNYVYRVDGSTGATLGTIGAGSPLSGPAGLAFGSDGKLYVGSFNTGQVLRFDGTTGAFLGVFATTPGAVSIGDVTFGPDGNLYGFVNDDVLRFNGTTGASLGSFLPPLAPHPGSANGFLAFGPDGNLYVADFDNDRVLRYQGNTGAFIDTFASGGGLDGPRGLAFIPEPATGALVGLGLMALASRRRRSSGPPRERGA
jgi:sugar lactone lactonase YvrE